MKEYISINTNKNIRKGFTIVEVVIVIPIVIIAIGVFITALINMTGEVLSSRASTNVIYSIQDALDRIEKDISISGAFLAANNITLTSPQGLNNDTTNFSNANATGGPILILNSYATTNNPSISTPNKIYVPNTPNACNSSSVSDNTPLMMNTVYFVKDGTLWRRMIAKSDYTTAGCQTPWQFASCAPELVSGNAFCKAQDTKLLTGIDTDGFKVEYYPGPNSTIPNTIASDHNQTSINRQAALQVNNTAIITLTATSTTAGKNITHTGSVRAVSKNNYILGN